MRKKPKSNKRPIRFNQRLLMVMIKMVILLRMLKNKRNLLLVQSLKMLRNQILINNLRRSTRWKVKSKPKNKNLV